AQVDVVSSRALEGCAEPAVAPHPGANDLFRQRGLRVEVGAINAVGMALRVLVVGVCVVWKVDLVEDLPVGRRQLAVGVRVAAVERIRQPAKRARVTPRIDLGARYTIGDTRRLGRMDVEV